MQDFTLSSYYNIENWNPYHKEDGTHHSLMEPADEPSSQLVILLNKKEDYYLQNTFIFHNFSNYMRTSNVYERCRSLKAAQENILGVKFESSKRNAFHSALKNFERYSVRSKFFIKIDIDEL